MSLQASKAALDKLDAADTARRETARSKNDLEAFILSMQVGHPALHSSACSTMGRHVLSLPTSELRASES